MFCMKCGCQIPEGAAFCPGCGQPVGTAIRQPGQPYVQSQQPYAQPHQVYAQPRQQYAQPQQTYAQPQQAPQPAAKKSGTGVGVKVAAAALAGLAFVLMYFILNYTKIGTYCNAIGSNDYSVVIALSFVYSALYIVVMLILDVLYCVLDPRVRLGGAPE